jgi:hypothetical protein
MENFVYWLRQATKAEKEELAKLADTSVQMFYKLQYTRDKGGRVASSDLAGRIEQAAQIISARHPGRFPSLTRADLSPACAQCPHFAGCKTKYVEAASEGL